MKAHSVTLRIAIGLFLVVVIISNTFYIADALPGDERVRTGWFIAPAVEGHEGQLVNISITVKRGVGKVYVQAGGSVSSSTKTSSELAFYIACTAAGVDWRNFNAIIQFHTSDSVEGPSASFGIALTTYLLLKGFNVSLDHVITGAISPDFSAVPIGGVDIKLKAAEASGYKLFLPLANLGDVDKSNRNETVFVTGIFNASRMLGYDPNTIFGLQLNNIGISIPRQYETRTMEDAVSMINMAYKNITVVPKDFASKYRPLYQSTLSLVEETNKTIHDGKIYPYSAASLAFRALVNATAFYEFYILSTNVSTMSKELGKVKESMVDLNDMLRKIRGNTLWEFELKSVAASRLAEANTTYLQLMKSYTSMNTLAQSWNLGYLKARLTSVSHWARLAILLSNKPPLISESNIHKALKSYIDYAQITLDYQLSLIKESKLSDELKNQLLKSLDRDKELLSMSQEYWANRNDTIAFGLAMEVMADSLSRFTGMVDTALAESLQYLQGVKSYTQELENTATILEMRALAYGYPSILTMDYIEYGKELTKMGDLETAQGITSYGVSSAIFWILVSHSTQLLQESNETLLNSSQNPPSTIQVTYLVSILFLGISIGYLLSVYSYRRILRGIEQSRLT
ncbi:MAG: hypothetical protein F7B59_05150 [Desulfurococcales archaeon]|nr:hypothetical protein [Desulfurococcales archaeon]